MSQIAQHQAAELWELARDHLIGATKIGIFAQMCQDVQARSALNQHAQRFQQIGQQIEQFLRDPGLGDFSATPPTAGQTAGTWQTGPIGVVGQVGVGTQTIAPGVTTADVVAVAACMEACKNMAVKCIWGATESAQPARNFLYQCAGEHLRMAEEHYHWLERHGAYAAPRVEFNAINDYVQTLDRIRAATQQVIQQAQPWLPQAVAQVTANWQGIAQQPAVNWSASSPLSLGIQPQQGSISGLAGDPLQLGVQPASEWQQYAQQYAPRLTTP